MKIDTAGNYTLRYTAEDECGNETVIDRSLVVAAPRTVLYTDGTFIINVSPSDMARNEQLHGIAIDTWNPLKQGYSTYAFSQASQRPWHSRASSVRHVEIGSQIQPTSMSYWFDSMTNLESVSLSNIDGENITSMEYVFNSCSNIQNIVIPFMTSAALTTIRGMFKGCTKLVSVDVGTVLTDGVTNMYDSFSSCSSLKTLDLSTWNTPNVTNTGSMFNVCSQLTTIYASTGFVTDQVTSSSSMFRICDLLVGGNGTGTSGNPRDKTYARIDNPPDAPGYFTLKPTA